ncbi:MAG: hypothetical protein AAF564_09640 [Bacteroidota bacterium]
MEATAEGAITIGIYLGSLYGLLKIIDWVFDQDDVIKEKSKKRLGNWLRNVKVKEPSSDWRDGFVAIFDKWFGEKHLSLKCFFRSALVTVAFYAVAWVLLFALPNEYNVFDARYIRSDYPILKILNGIGIPGLLVAIISGLWLNVFPDYMSLFETRILLNFLKGRSSFLVISFFLIIDFVLTFAALAVSWLLFDLVVFYELRIDQLIETIRGFEVSSEAGYHETSISILTTFFTSIWIWVYSLAAILVKLVGKTQSGLHFLKVHLDLENKPFKSIGKVIQLIVVIAYAVTGVFLLI